MHEFPQIAEPSSMQARYINLVYLRKDVTVYCDIKGIESVLENSADINTTLPSSRESRGELLNRAIDFPASPGRMKAAV